LRAPEAALRALFTSMNVLILVLDASGRYLKIASTNPSLLYRPSDELMGKRLHDVFPHEQADFFLSHIQRTLETRETVNFEYDLRIAGRDLWFSSTISPLTDTSVIWVARDITERKQSESALRESEARFRALTDSTASAIFIYQSDKIRYVNHTVETLTGYSRNELSGIKFWDLVHPDFRDLVRERGLARQRGESVPPRYEFKMITKTGEERWLDFTAGIIEYDGTPALVGTAFDITDRKRSEEIQSAVYRISQTADIAVNLDDLFRLIHGIIQEVMPAQNFYIALYDEQEDVVSFPYFVDEVDEPSPPHKLGRGLTEYVLRTGKSLLCDEAMDRELLRRGEVELVGVSSPVWLGVPIIIEEKPIGVMVVQHYSDEKAYGASEQQILEFVSSQVAKAIDRKRRQEALAIQQSYFQHLFENSPAGIVIMNEADLVINVNKAFEHIFQYTIDEIRGVNLNELIVPESYLEEAFELSMKPQQRQITQRETVRKRRDGTLVNVSFTGYPIVLENELVGITGMYIDITERTQLEDQLRQAQKLESLGTLAGGIAHDFNNILGIILGHASILSSAKQDPMKLSHSIDVIAKASERGAGLVRQLLTFARKTDVLLESVRVNDTVNEVVNLLRQTFPKTIAITVQLEDRLPSIIADANQLHQVLLNLSVNARDAMPSGGTLQMTTALIAGSVVRTKYTKATDTEYVLIQVADSGVGMDEATRSRVFEPFFTTKELGKGTGLGLASVYGIVESHSAFIDVESELRRGTSFNLYFPVHPRGMTIPEMKEVVREEIPGGNETILVVEDEEMLQELVKSILSRKGYETLIAGDGEAAVSLYVQKHHEIAAVLSDLGLPKLGGRDVFLRLKETNPAVKVIIASGYMEPTIKNEMFKAGVKGFIQKPYVPDEILKKIRHVLDQHNA
ncbi:MAG: PAS domain S-box protein, partial [Ignavibacteriales bacterium]|nr:PAS domain S-box protein [Ignavibacteriales bacterium]